MTKSKNKYLIVKGCAGIGNRLITLTNAIEYAQRNSRILYVDWRDGQFGPFGENVFYDFFHLEDVPFVSSFEEINYFPLKDIYPKRWANQVNSRIYDLFIEESTTLLKKIPNKLIPKGSLRKIYGYWRPISELTTQPSYSDIRCVLNLFNQNYMLPGGDYPDNITQRILIFADWYPPYKKEIFLNHIRINSIYHQKFISIQSNLNIGKNTIGVHIRATDKQPSVVLDKLINKLNEFPNFKIFLATDSKNTFKFLNEKLPNIITFNKFFPEVQRQGLHQWALYSNRQDFAKRITEECITEMFLLSKCEYLFYQGNSTFSEISKLWHNDINKTLDWNKL